MPIYHALGSLPHKRHTVFRRDGALLAEELIGNKGFSGPSSLRLHVHLPTPGPLIERSVTVALAREDDTTVGRTSGAGLRIGNRERPVR